MMGFVRGVVLSVPSSDGSSRTGLEASSGMCFGMRPGSSRERLLVEATRRAAREVRSLVQEAGVCQFGGLWTDARWKSDDILWGC